MYVAQERERETIEEEKAQVDRYKQLLLKQRDIMIALTQRLVERDEQIMSLQDELDAYVSSIFIHTTMLCNTYQLCDVYPRTVITKSWKKSWTRKLPCSSSSSGFPWK